MKKKFYAVCMMGMIVSGMVTGCGSNQKAPTENTNQTVDTTQDNQETENEEEQQETVLEEEGTETDPSVAQETLFVITDGIELPYAENMDSAIFKDTYGIDESLLESYVVRMPLANVIATEIGVFELKDAKDAETVKAAIQKRVDALLQQWESYLPAQYDLVKNHKIVEKGNFILFVISEEADTIVERFEATVQ